MLFLDRFDDAPHGHAELSFKDVVVDVKESLLLGLGRGFEAAQRRLGPGRIHHCMRLIGMAERGLELMIARAQTRHAFGRMLLELGTTSSLIAMSRAEIDQARLLVLEAAISIDNADPQNPGQSHQVRKFVAMIKFVVPSVTTNVLDRAIQVAGAKGVSQDTPLAHLWSMARALRIADGPDEVHQATVAKLETQRAKL